MRDDEIRERNEAVQEANGLVNPAPRRLTLREQNDQLRRELTRLQEDRALDRQPAVVREGRPETPRETIERLRRTVQPPVVQPPPRNLNQWWTEEPVNPQPPPQGQQHVHFTNVNDPEHWGDVDATGPGGEIIGAGNPRGLGNHPERIERGDMAEVQAWPRETYRPPAKQPEPPDIMGKPEDHFL
jgi:hypothetical protein